MPSFPRFSLLLAATIACSSTIQAFSIAPRDISFADQVSPLEFLSKRAFVTSCPTAEIGFMGDGSSNRGYAFCEYTDYEAPSMEIHHGVKDRETCAGYCQRYNGCTKASFDRKLKMCHIKGDPSNAPAVTTGDFDSMRLVYIAQEGYTIQGCPLAEATVTTANGKSYKTCPASDYAAPSMSIRYGINSLNDCIKICSETSKCLRASYNKAAKQCHLKGDNVNLRWVTNPAFASIYVNNASPAPAPAPAPAKRCEV